jgi:chorismate lyase
LQDLGLSAPLWLPQDELPLAADDVRRDWLLEPGSLTRKLQAERDGAFRLELITQVAEPLPVAVATMLDSAAGDPGHRREVRLFAGETACISARSYWPEITERDQDWLDDLGERPLGEALFTHPEASRGPIEVACIAGGDRRSEPLLAGATAAADEVWARRSVFRIGGAAPLLVHEYFLPALFASSPSEVG